MLFSNHFVHLVTHKSTMCISCTCTYYLHTRQRKEEEKIFTTWQIYHGQSLLVKIDRSHKQKKKISRWFHKETKTKTQLVGKNGQHPSTYTTNITLIALQSKKLSKVTSRGASGIILVLGIIILACSSKTAMIFLRIYSF